MKIDLREKLTGKNIFNWCIRHHLYLIPLFLVAFVPLIMRYCRYDPNLYGYSWYDGYYKSDIFLYYKMVVLEKLGIVLALILVGALIRYIVLQVETFEPVLKGKWGRILFWTPLVAYLGFAVVSTVKSRYHYFGYNGMHAQFESLWVLLAYGVIALSACCLVNSESAAKKLMFFFFVGTSIVSGIGMLQYFGKDFFSTKWASLMIYGQEGGTFEVLTSRVYSTLYNPNYVGMFAALVIPVLVGMMMAVRKWWSKILCIPPLLVAVGAALVSIVGSESEPAIVALIITSVLMFVLYFKQIIRCWYVSIPIICTLLIGAKYVYLTQDLMTKLEYASEFEKGAPYTFSRLVTHEDMIEFTVDGKTYFAYFDGLTQAPDDIRVLNEQKEELETVVSEDGTRLYIVEEESKSLSFYRTVCGENVQAMVLNRWGQEFTFTNQLGDPAVYRLMSPTGFFSTYNSDEIESYEPLEGYDGWISHRGYIWRRAIPMLKDCKWLGTGADSFAVAYPNDDYLGMMNTGYYGRVITKPHSMYLQIGIQTGLASLAMYMLLVAFYFIQTLWMVLRGSMRTYAQLLSVGVMAGIVGYLITAATNDSTVGVAPLYWLLLGLGVALNRISERQIAQAKQERKERRQKRKEEKALRKEQKEAQTQGTESTEPVEIEPIDIGEWMKETEESMEEMKEMETEDSTEEIKSMEIEDSTEETESMEGEEDTEIIDAMDDDSTDESEE